MTKSKNNTQHKLKDLEQLAFVLDEERAHGKRVVQCHGVFDLLHIGHIRHFEQAKKMGDLLVVTITTDQHVNKGPHRPAFVEEFRAEAIAALECVDHVAISKLPSAVESIKLLKPDVYAKGAEYRNPDNDATNKIVDEEAAVKSIGGEIAFTDNEVVFSSTNIINRHLPIFPKEVQEYLAQFSERHSPDDVLAYLDKAAAMKVLVVGETIIDEYEYAAAMGSSTKEPILATRYMSSEKFAGGILAIANHTANFCDTVDMVTFLGCKDTQEEFIRQHLHSDVEPFFLYQSNSSTIVKRRIVEGFLLRKLFEIYVMDDEEISEGENQQLCALLEELLPRYDLVIVADYGHGMMTAKAREILCSKARALAVNTQTNAGNRGFNTIAKYGRSDFISLTHREISLEERLQRGDLKQMILSLSERLNCAQVLVTLGKDGNICYRVAEGFSEAPALANQIVDTMGAGDAVLSLSALYMAQQAPLEIVGFIGNVVGAQAVATLGHQTSIGKLDLYRHIEALLK